MRTGRQNEEAFKPGRAGTLLDALEQALSVPLILHGSRHGQTCHLADPLVGEGIQGCATKDHPVVFDDGEVADFTLDEGPVAPNQRTVFFEWT